LLCHISAERLGEKKGSIVCVNGGSRKSNRRIVNLRGHLAGYCGYMDVAVVQVRVRSHHVLGHEELASSADGEDVIAVPNDEPQLELLVFGSHDPRRPFSRLGRQVHGPWMSALSYCHRCVVQRDGSPFDHLNVPFAAPPHPCPVAISTHIATQDWACQEPSFAG